MNLSIVPIYLAVVFLFCFLLVRRASKNEFIEKAVERKILLLLLAFIVWSVSIALLALGDQHISLMAKIPLLWQAFVPVVIWITALILSAELRSGLLKIATHTPAHWFVLIQSLRLGAIGGVVKGLNGEIASGYIFWIGIPDFLFGLSALFIGLLMMNRKIKARLLLVWHLIGFSLIFFPTFVIMSYWMNEPGFVFIFEYPMILAPGMLVPLLISLNLLHAWGLFQNERQSQLQSLQT
ncbi:MAG: hypothetical protein N0C81_04100 [Candidatus Thiodiazotropha lotti]|uniref:Uncharacterized protein n=1 Tax=Candidatus Thiodiazotropha lotti TaxID=2792787 RepID=A0A9E4MYZ2_9GAMM|nr:hypothetical protein [Candidatus Thiodiazotropha lotti]MCG7922884.1 hypothetical protein [Candidatus Thiodiazotropha lotti]MCG7930507.1 hypothetical protein [Candidatus Thiodiazotropha lotti]MCG7937653.1 hypothetical protein [Candidatus Thiodiazotropha lotti]MCG7988664.1 hypothetical protein [Candidatus Thiodiazotropha lotti]